MAPSLLVLVLFSTIPMVCILKYRSDRLLFSVENPIFILSLPPPDAFYQVFDVVLRTLQLHSLQTKRDYKMDLVYLGLTLGFAALTFAFVAACHKLEGK